MKFIGTKSEIKEIASKYRLKVKGVKRIRNGMINSSFEIVTDNGKKYVLRVYYKNGRTRKQIVTELDIIDYFMKAGIPVPKIKKNINGKLLTYFYDTKNKTRWKTILIDFVYGRPLSPKDYLFISTCAEYQSKMHRLTIDYNNSRNIDSSFKDIVRWMKDEHKNVIKNLSNKIVLEYSKIVTDILLQLDTVDNKIKFLAAGYVHLDYDSTNIIVDNTSIRGIIDFDDLSYQPLILDSAFSLWWWLFFNKSSYIKKILRLYIKGYERNRKITNIEKQLLPTFIRMRNAILAGLLFINSKKKPDLKSFRKAIEFDSVLRGLKI